MSEYLTRHGGTRSTLQSEPMRSDQIENTAGGYVWAVDCWTRLRRFLILGSEGGSYYASERELTLENIGAVREALAEDGTRFVDEVIAISEGGRAPKNDPALYALAVAISHGDKPTRRYAAASLPRVARIGTHLYHFCAYAETMRGWGRTMRWAVGNWYDRNPYELALQAIKYRQRDGWDRRDPARLAHPGVERPLPEDLRDVMGFISGNVNHTPVLDEELGRIVRQVEPWQETEQTHPLISGYLRASESTSPAETARLVREFNLPREALKTEHLNDPGVWVAMLYEGGKYGMPITALLRNLANMTRIGVFDSRDALDKATQMLTARVLLEHARVHPLAILIALRTYASGRGFRGSNTWAPKPDLIDALDEAFYLAFDNVEPTGKSILLALDVSGSMDQGQVAGSPLTPREAAAAMALVTLHAEPDVEVVGFHAGVGGLDFGISPRWGHYNIHDAITPLGLSRRQRLDDVVGMMQRLEMGGTDCALPFRYATELEKKYDAVIIYTDSETWAGPVHPKQALDEYRRRSGIMAKSVVVGMVSNGFTIADPTDAGMMDVVGFDTAAPALISEFVAGRL